MNQETLIKYWKILDYENQKAGGLDEETIRYSSEGTTYLPLDKESCIFVGEEVTFLVRASGHRITTMEEIPEWVIK